MKKQHFRIVSSPFHKTQAQLQSLKLLQDNSLFLKTMTESCKIFVYNGLLGSSQLLMHFLARG